MPSRRDLLMALVGIVLCTVLSPSAHASTVSHETWANRGRWNDLGQSCTTISGGLAMMRCQSAALVSSFTLPPHQALSLSGTVRAQAAPGSSTPNYFGSLALVEDDPSGKYLDLATFNAVAPFSPQWGPSLGACCQLLNGGRRFADGNPGQWYAFQIDYVPGTVTYSVDGTVRGTVPWTLQQAPRVWLLCVSVGEATPSDGSQAACDFGPLTISPALCAPSYVRRCA